MTHIKFQVLRSQKCEYGALVAGQTYVLGVVIPAACVRLCVYVPTYGQGVALCAPCSLRAPVCPRAYVQPGGCVLRSLFLACACVPACLRAIRGLHVVFPASSVRWCGSDVCPQSEKSDDHGGKLACSKSSTTNTIFVGYILSTTNTIFVG